MRKQPEEAARTRAWLRLPSWEEAKAQSPTLAFLPPLASRALGLRGGQSPQWQQVLTVRAVRGGFQRGAWDLGVRQEGR